MTGNNPSEEPDIEIESQNGEMQESPQEGKPQEFSRRQVLTMISGLIGGVALSAVAPPFTGRGQTIPPEEQTETPPAEPSQEIGDIAEAQELVSNMNAKMERFYRRLILPTVQSDESGESIPDWEMTRQSLNVWGINPYLVPSGLPAPASARSTDVDVALLVGPANAPMPIGLQNLYSNTDFGWERFYEDNEHTYFAATVNGKTHPYAGYLYNQLNPQAANTLLSNTPLVEAPHGETEEGYTYEKASEQGYQNYGFAEASATTERSTVDYDYIQGAKLSSLYTQLIEKYPDLNREVVISASDGYTDPNVLGVCENPNVINPQSSELPYSFLHPDHNCITQIIINGDGKNFSGLVGPKASIEVVGSMYTGFHNGVSKVIEDRLNLLEAGKKLPITVFNHPYILAFNLDPLKIRGQSFSWSQPEFLEYLKRLNIIVVASLGNTSRVFDTREQGINPKDEAQIGLIRDTHLAATKGLIIGNRMHIDTGRGIPHTDDDLLNDITYVAPGHFPAGGLVSALTLKPENNFNTVAPALSRFGHSPSLIEQYASGSSFAVTAIAAQIAAYASVLKLRETELTASEILRRFNSDMQRVDIPVHGESDQTRNLRLAKSNHIIQMLNSVINPGGFNTRLPGIMKESNAWGTQIE